MADKALFFTQEITMGIEAELGKLITKTDASRDCVHIAIVPLIAGEQIWRGEFIKLAYGTANVALKAETAYGDDVIGVADPYLSQYRIEKGQRFYGFLTPGTVTGMTHRWQHPAFDNPPQPKDEHEKWLREFCDKWNFRFDDLIQAGVSENEGDYVTAHGRDIHSRRDFDDGEETEFWMHLEAFTGREFSEEHRARERWSCSC